MNSLIDTYHAYVDDPHRFWSGPSLRQADKLDQKKRALASEMGWPVGEVADRVIDLVKSRSSPHPVYVTGLGGSGSHWLAGMLGDLPEFFDVGEVYFPPRLCEKLDEETESAPTVIDALHLIHARSKATAAARPINCAAGAARTGRYLAWDPQAVVVYLIRDPRDQVLSTTFRKSEYRTYLGGHDDVEYLQHRCRLNRNDRQGYVGGGVAADVTVRFEDLGRAPIDEIERILEVVGIQVESHVLQEVVEARDAAAIKEGRSDRAGNLNLDHGLRPWSQDSPRWTAAIHAELAPEIEGLGYPFGRCLVDPTRTNTSAPGPADPPPGVRLRGWDGSGWNRSATGGPWLAEIVAIEDAQSEWLGSSPIQAVCAARLSRVTDTWLMAVLKNPVLRSLDLGGVTISDTQADILLAYGSRLNAVGLWRSADPAVIHRVQDSLPAATVFA